jgi:hypothetical protein
MRLGALNITCKAVGEDVPPWGHGEGRPVYKYRVRVTHSAFKTSNYSTYAWGSINDHQKGKHDCDGIGAMVVDELLSAASDPDEFVHMVMGEAKGREALKRGREGEKVVKAAKKFRYEELRQAVEEAQEKGIL